MSESWTIKIADWNQLPETFLDGNWKQAKVASSEKISIPKKSGIYMYCIAVPNAKNLKLKKLNTPIYMGIAKNLRERFVDHLRPEDSLYESRKCYGSNMNFFFLIIEPYIKEEFRVLYEQPMIDCFGKVVNKIDSVGKDNPIRGNVKTFKRL